MMDATTTMSDDDAKSSSSALVRLVDQPPTVLPAIVLDDLVPFPGPMVPIVLEDAERRDAVLHAKSNAGFVMLVNRRAVLEHVAKPMPHVVLEGGEAGEQVRITVAEPEVVVDEVAEEQARVERGRKLQVADLAPVGIVARLVRVLRLPDERTSALLVLMRRAQSIEVLRSEPFPILRVLYPVELIPDDQEFEAVVRQLRSQLQAFFAAHTQASEELKTAVMSIEEPGALADFVAQHLSRDFHERLSFLAELDLGRRVRRALEVTVRELDLLTVGNRITQEIRDKVEKTQREYFLREQLKSIRLELGEEKDEKTLAIEELERKLEAARLPEPARGRADDELRRLRLLTQESPEHNVIRSYLDWIASLPWSKSSVEATDIVRAREILDEDHYGLDEVKDRIIEFLAVRQLEPEAAGTMLCFAGPPGVGKTSLGQSIARALGRQFYRFSVGGMRDEAEIKGHRRTYIGAMPGRILQGLKQVQTNNPVFMLDEIDKMGSDWRGDPSSAMLEVLDPAQNASFLDHYLDLSFDLSKVMFIATANIKTEIPSPLLDRMEVIDLAGYIPSEKLEIATRYLVPRQRKAHGLSAKQLRVSRAGLQRVIAEYTHEAGVRELERQVAKLCRKRATQIVRRQLAPVTVQADDLPAWLGPPKLHEERLVLGPTPGIATGLAWTQIGGEVLFIEAAAMEGKGGLKVTGHLGDVMAESASLAVSYVRSRAHELGIDPKVFSEKDFHLHFPAGAVRKDGPSAGVTVTTALVSLLTGRPIRPRLAMTGEMTLRGEVLPVGGIREKVVAARRSGVQVVVLPERNRADVEEIPREVREKLSFVFAVTYEDILAAAFPRSVARERRRARAEL